MAPKRKRAPGQTKVSQMKAQKTTPAKPATLFDQYADTSDPDVIGPEGIEKLCSSLGITPADRCVLILAWKMDASRMGFFTRDEFNQGMKALNTSTLPQLKKALPKLDAMVQHPSSFSDFYDFAFKFCLTEPGQKIVDAETIAQLLPIVLPDGRFVSPFCEFLVTQQDYKKINADQWVNFLRFSLEVASDMSNAEDNPAWPVLIDNFVDWYRSKSSS